MKYLLTETKLFTLGHKIYVMDDKNIITTITASTKDLPEVLCEISINFHCDAIKLKGNKSYNQKIKTRIQSTFAAKYNSTCPFTIELI